MPVTVFYFSPNGTTKALALRLGKALGMDQAIDITPSQARETSYTFAPGDRVVVAFPSYSNRLPSVATEVLSRLEGNGATAVGLISFGNNHYETALTELHQNLVERGFQVTALGGFVAAHCIMRGVAKGRPNAEDLAQVDTFALAIAEKCLQGDPALPTPQEVSFPDLSSMPLAPTPDLDCIGCMACAAGCPVNAIAPRDPTVVDVTRCILCYRCVNVCPTSCRKVRAEPFQAQMAALREILLQEEKSNYTQL